MGHWNTQFSNHLLNPEANDQSHSRRQSEPSIFYGNVPNNFHHNPNHPIARSLVPPTNNFNFHRMPEHGENVLLHNMVQYRGVPPQHPPAYLDLAVTQPSNHYSPYSVSGDLLPIQVNQGANVRLSLPSPHYGAANFPQITALMDDDPMKRKNLEIASAILPCRNNAGEASSSGGSQNAAPFVAPNEYMGNLQPPFIEGESSRTVTNRPDMIGRGAANIPYSASSIVQGSNNSLVPLHANPWSDMTSFGSCNGDIGTYLWAAAPNFPYMHAANGTRAENLGFQCYQLAPSNQNSHGFMRPAFVLRPPFLHLQSLGYGINRPLQVGASSQSFSSSNVGMNPYQNVLEGGSISVAPIQSQGVRLLGPHTREPSIGPNERHQNPRGLRFFRSDETAILDITGAEASAESSVDQHNEMRMDIEDMSYEELLALEEEIGFVATGLSEEFTESNLKSRNYTLSEVAGVELEDIICAVCQNEYANGDVIASLDCGHEYHKGCIKQWLVLRNTCPVCKAEALRCKEQ